MLPVKPGPPDAKRSLELIDYAQERTRTEYAELAENWKLLETKAQGTAVIAGVFLAALLSFVKDSATALQGPVMIFFAIALLLFLGLAIWYSVEVLRVADVEIPPAAREVSEGIANLLGPNLTDRDRDEGMVRLKQRVLAEWIAVNSKLHYANEEKGAKLLLAQGLLRAGAVVCMLLVVGKLSLG